MALRVKSFYATNIVIDGEIIPIRIGRMNPDQALEFNQRFTDLGTTKSDDPEIERRSKRFIVEAISTHVTVEPNQIYLDDGEESITAGAEVCRIFGARDEVLGELLLDIFMENKLNTEQKHTWKTKLAPFVPTPASVADRMMANANVTPADVVYDLGCGDGALCIAAAKRGARAFGFDMDSVRIAAAKVAAQEAGVSDLCTFEQKDALTVDLRAATVVSLYLLAGSNVKLRPLFEAQLPAGARVVSHAFTMGAAWEADSAVFVDPVDGETIAHSGARWVYTYSMDRIRGTQAA